VLWSVAAAILVAGLMIGLTGIGGVLVVPALTGFAAIPLDRAIAASMIGFLIAGVPAAVLHIRRSPPHLPQVWLAGALAAAGSAAGAGTLDWLPPQSVKLSIALLAVGSGIYAFFRIETPASKRIAAPVLAAIALAIGYGSAITGTGGPVMMIPALLFLGMPVREAIALGVAVQVPITLVATLVNVAQERLDLLLAATVSAVLLCGTLAGAWLSGRLSGRAIKTSVALVLIATGIWYGLAAFMAT
jgi:uncharacterized protein